ncbi:hypothetical protein [Fluviispira sanaruensis]|uniref:Uncharacterized protein n=1 Tax=Fluviispira sanaruensis TaxID=2493639 RepID=A0A4P2VQB2_FLUSA|nr:hypothetical protein [Fluviispira sanaruensis]BBH54179.1 hypothetical protein JCM31447_26370 [Fluviispira sanaruensis]
MNFIIRFSVCSLLTASNYAFAEQALELSSMEQAPDITLSAKQYISLPTETFASENHLPLTAGYNITIVNHSNRTACISIVEANPLLSKGWYIVQNTQSITFNSLAYIRLEVCSLQNLVWNTGWVYQDICLKYGSAFSFNDPTNAIMCSSNGGQMKQFLSIPGAYTVTLK